MIIKNLGPIKDLHIHLNKETILFGKNNAGKTYVSYLLYGVYKKFDSLKAEILADYFQQDINLQETNFSITFEKELLIQFLKDQALARLNREIVNELPKIFNLMADDFVETEITVEEQDIEFILLGAMEKEFQRSVPRRSIKPSLRGILHVSSTAEAWSFEMTNIAVVSLFGTEDTGELEEPLQQEVISFFQKTIVSYLATTVFKLPNIVYIPAERNGINVFRNELINKRSSHTFDLEGEKQVSTYPLAISDYMRYLSMLTFTDNEAVINHLNQSNPAREELWLYFSEHILQGKYEFENETNEYYYRELFSVNKDGKLSFKKKRIPLKVASSSTKSLFGLENYLRFQFQSGDLLFIDEPEMNLDPENQVRMAKLLVRLADLGVSVVISTHSDYLTRATANEVLKYKVREKEQQTASTMSGSTVSGYYFERGKIEVFEDFVNVDYVQNFDDVNIALEEEYFAIRDQLENVSGKELFVFKGKYFHLEKVRFDH